MLWTEVTISTTSFGVEPVCDRLDALGINELVVEDEADFRRFLEENRPHWDYVDDKLLRYYEGRSAVKFYVRDDEDAAGTIRTAEEHMQKLAALFPAGSLGSLEFSFRKVEEDDWAENWKTFFKPIPVDEQMVIVPAWENLSDYPAYAGMQPLVINPGLLFGSGSHETTMLCLSQIIARLREGDEVLDLGCGSGILAIAALLRGACRAVACDVDPAAEKIVCENASLNRLGGERLPVLIGDVTEESPVRRELFSRKYRVVCSNIVADVLIALCPHVPGLLDDDGVWITSGIIDDRLEDVLAAARDAGLEPVEVKGAGCWYCAVFARRER